MTITEKTNRFSNLVKNFDRVATDWLNSNSAIIIDEMRLMWDKGEAGNGKMPMYKSLSYQARKKEGGVSISGNYYDLKLTGDFRDAMIAKPSSKGVQITSNDSKTGKINTLTKGSTIWKLNKEHQTNFVEMALPELQTTLKKSIL